MMASAEDETSADVQSPVVGEQEMETTGFSGLEAKMGPSSIFLEMLDQVENHVEKLRVDVLKLEEERDTLLTTLDTMKNNEQLAELSKVEKEEIINFADRLISRCLTVEISVNTPRNHLQEDALYQVNDLINKLVISMQEDSEGTKAKCVTYMNSCLNIQRGNVDNHFEKALLACAADDQKRVRRRLQGLLDYFEDGRNKVEISPV